jgi:hypothetical protein
MSYNFNFMKLTVPQSSEWRALANAAGNQATTRRSAGTTPKFRKEPRWFEVQGQQSKVWMRASSPKGRL